MRVGKIEQSVGQNLYNGGWQLIHEKLFVAAATTYTISGLDGDTDEEYRLICRIVSGQASGDCDYKIKINNDGDSNYGRQKIQGRSNVVSAERETRTGISIGYIAEPSRINISDTLIHAKSGYIRTGLNSFIDDITTTTIYQLLKCGHSWNNTVDNITSLVIDANTANGLGIGTHIFLFKRQKLGSEATTGIKIGKQELQGSLKIGTFQKIYSKTITALVYSADLCTGGTPFADSGTAANAFDNTSSEWESDNVASPHYIGYDFGAGNTKIIRRYTIQARTGGEAMGSPIEWTFQGSNNYSDWDTLDTKSVAPWSLNEKRTYDINNAVAYRYYRIYGTSFQERDYCTIQEVEMMDATGDGALTSVTISGLDGDTDILYELRVRAIQAVELASTITIRLNNDSETNYGYQQLHGSDTTIDAIRETTEVDIRIGSINDTIGMISFSDVLLYAKSGYIRTGFTKYIIDIVTTTIAGLHLRGFSWNNTADNIISIVLSSNRTNGLAIGTVIELWALRKS